MASKETAPAEPEQTVPEAVSNWEFVGHAPTEDEVKALLRTLPAAYGVEYLAYYEHVQALPQKKKYQVPHPTNPKVKVDEYVEAWTLYMSVAGRIKMLNDIAVLNGWCVDFEPEPVTPTGIPGMLQFDSKIVYREYVVVVDGDGRAIGRRPGTAWVPASGGKQAAGSNPFEKVETSARGRAIAAWGIGVLPGSGVASVEEMSGVSQNRAALEQERQHDQADGPRQRMSHDELVTDVMTAAEEWRDALGSTEEEAMNKVKVYLADKLQIRGVLTDVGDVVWQRVKDGQLSLLAKKMREQAQDARAQKPL